MKTITLTHANFKQPVEFNSGLIFYWYWSEAQKCTLVVSNAGAFAPVLESVNDISRFMKSEGSVDAPKET